MFFLIKSKRRSTHQSLTWTSQTAGHWDAELAWGRLCFCITQENWHGHRDSQESTLTARLLLLFSEQISLMWWWETSLRSLDFFQQTEVLETEEKIISTNLRFPSTSGEDSQSVLLPPLAGYTGLTGDSSLAIATLVGPRSASTEVNMCPSLDHNRSCTGAQDLWPVVFWR